MDPVSALKMTLDGAAAKVNAIKVSDLNKPTPCQGWTLKELLNHMIGVNAMFTMSLNGQAMPAGGESPDFVGSDPSGAYKKSIEAVHAAWSKPGALDGTIKLPFGEMPRAMAIGINIGDQTLHTWDIAKTLGQDATLPAEQATAVLGGLKSVLSDDLRGPGKPFAPAVQVSADASVTEQLVAFSGRNPNWKP